MSSEHFYELAKQFARPDSLDAEDRVKDWQDGSAIFLRLNDYNRLELVDAIIRAWVDDLPLNRSMISGALRHGWDSEPYTNGVRLGSYISAVAEAHDGSDWTIRDFVDDWGPDLMRADEADQLETFEFPLTVYRGGTDDFHLLAQGVSWSFDFEIASFYANTWPKRWGDARQPLILSMTVERQEVVAFLNDRKESELLLPNAPHRIESMQIVNGEQAAAATA